MDVNHVGYFLNIKQAARPEQKWENVKPLLTFDIDGKVANFEPIQNGQAIRFVTTKKLGLGVGQCVRIY